MCNKEQGYYQSQVIDLEEIRQSPRQFIDLETVERLSDYSMMLERQLAASQAEKEEWVTRNAEKVTELLVLRNELAASQAENLRHQWQPIETAPKDGSHFLAAPTRSNCKPFVALWLDAEYPEVDGEGWYGHWNFDPVEFVAWMPLPPVPDATPPGDQSH